MLVKTVCIHDSISSRDSEARSQSAQVSNWVKVGDSYMAVDTITAPVAGVGGVAKGCINTGDERFIDDFACLSRLSGRDKQHQGDSEDGQDGLHDV